MTREERMIECDGFCGAMVEALTSKKIWMTRDGDDYQADLCEPCLIRLKAELKSAGIGLTLHIREKRDFADAIEAPETRE